MFWIDFFIGGVCLLFTLAAVGLAATIVVSRLMVNKRRRRERSEQDQESDWTPR